MVELLQAGTTNGGSTLRKLPTAPAAKVQRAAARPKTIPAQKQLRGRTQIGGAKTKAGRDLRSVSKDGDLTRVDMIAAVLKRYPRRTVRELISLLDKEFRWKTTESAVTSNLYTRRDKFAHTQVDRVTNRPVTWSLK